MLTPDQLAEIEQRAAAAADGPWSVYHEAPTPPNRWNHNRSVWAEKVGEYSVCDLDGTNSEADSEFIAHAREDIPALLATVRELQARIAQLEQIIEPGKASGMAQALFDLASECGMSPVSSKAPAWHIRQYIAELQAENKRLKDCK